MYVSNTWCVLLAWDVVGGGVRLGELLGAALDGVEAVVGDVGLDVLLN